VRNGRNITLAATDRLGRLSPRETQVLEETSIGLTNEQVAARLDVTVHAVKFHLAAIYRKLGVANRTEAAALYLTAAAAAVPVRD
jgi:DNA-binding CsgD family transcriptional regulator